MTTQDFKAAIPHFWGYAPAERVGARGMPLTFNFTADVTTAELDLFKENAEGILPFVQSMWIDNYANPDALVILIRQMNQRIIIPAFSQAVRPVFAPDQVQLALATGPDMIGEATSKDVQLILLNVPVPIFTATIES